MYDLGRSFYDAITSTITYVRDDKLREKILHELVETNKLLRKAKPPMPVVNTEQLENDMAEGDGLERRH